MKALMASVAAATLMTGSALAQDVDATLPEDSDGTALMQESDATQAAVAPSDIPFIQQQHDGDLLASNWMGEDVYGSNGESVGTVDDLILAGDGKISGIVIGVGGFLGLGAKDIAVDMDSIKTSNDPETGAVTLHIAASAEQLEMAPGFQTLVAVRAEQEAQRLEESAPVLTEPATAPQ